jgi:hypothetical protein
VGSYTQSALEIRSRYITPLGQHKGCPISRRPSNTRESKCDSMCRAVVSLFQYDQTCGRTKPAHLWTKGSQIQERVLALRDCVFDIPFDVPWMLWQLFPDRRLQLSKECIARCSLGMPQRVATVQLWSASADLNGFGNDIHNYRPMYVVVGPKELAGNIGSRR